MMKILNRDGQTQGMNGPFQHSSDGLNTREILLRFAVFEYTYVRTKENV